MYLLITAIQASYGNRRTRNSRSPVDNIHLTGMNI